MLVTRIFGRLRIWASYVAVVCAGFVSFLLFRFPFNFTAKRLLRHRNSQRYFRDGQWTENPQEATDFRNIREAVETCVRNELREVDLILRFDGTSIEIVVRIR